ncbi:MAG: glycoside hydrolase family 95 protein [Bacteroidaceae bacterium]|nr:glycoside hydrolase family 95 protein [Bacteroidaceae bacterium]
MIKRITTLLIALCAFAVVKAQAPTFSTEEAPVWYYIQFKTGEAILGDQGDGNNLLTMQGAESPNQWALIGTAESFYLKSRWGNYVYFTNSKFASSSTSKTALKLISSPGNSGYYEIQRATASQSMNQWGGSGAGKELGEWNAGDVNNPLAFVTEMPAPVPDFFSYEDAPEYYYIKFANGGNLLVDNGDGTNVTTAVIKNETKNQWMMMGSPSMFYMKSQAGYWLYYDADKGLFTSSSTSRTPMKLVKTGNADYEGCYEIQRTASNKSMNQNGGTAVGVTLCEWNAGDANNPLTINPCTPPVPAMSDAENEYWYAIHYVGVDQYLCDAEVGSVPGHVNPIVKKENLWKFTGTKDNMQIISNSGKYLSVVNDVPVLADEAYAAGFKLVETNYTTNPYKWEIHSADAALSKYKLQLRKASGEIKDLALASTSRSAYYPVVFMSPDEVRENNDDYYVAAIEGYTPEHKHTLWYTQPATLTGVSNTWMEYSLPIGNGQLGASLFGGIQTDEIQFNEKTLWSGGPSQYGIYENFGSVFVDDMSYEFGYGADNGVTDYYRQLDLENATGTVCYKNSDKSVTYKREYIASNPDKAVVWRYTASEEGKISLRFTMASGAPGIVATTSYSEGTATFSGSLQTISYAAHLKVVPDGGTMKTTDSGILVEGANSVLVVLVGITDFVADQVSHVSGRKAELLSDAAAQADAAATQGWEALYSKHVADYEQYYNRVAFEIAGTDNVMPTNEMVDAYNAGTMAGNLMLEQLYFHYGRYLEISSSRGVDLPNNLQGIWNNRSDAPWHSDIHANINVQMNYWPAEPTNLSEMHVPFLNYIINEAAQPEWQNRANISGQARGWTCLTENNIFGGISGFAPNYVIANAWYVTHLWQHYRYTLDKEYLAKAFPAMLGASQFWADRMVLASDGTYECPNEYSPEHGPGSENAVAHAQQIAWECLDNTIKAADILGGVEAGVITEADYNLITDRFARMDKGIATETYTGEWGATYNDVPTGAKIIREWKYSKFTASSDRGHRHMSHLMALYPFGQITPSSDFFEPAINSMKLRGDESTGWSMGWKINLWARALMGDRSHAILRKALKHSTSYGTNQYAGGIYYNLYDSHAPFQIDGNFGACSGIAEMMLQSHSDTLQILPALPTAWPDGEYAGLKAVGDFTVGAKWADGKATQISISNNQGQPLYVNYPGLDQATIYVNDAVVAPEKVSDNTYFIPSQAKDNINIFFGEVPTGIEDTVADKVDGDSPVYDLMGRKVTAPVKGRIYIQDSKKFIAE